MPRVSLHPDIPRGSDVCGSLCSIPRDLLRDTTHPHLNVRVPAVAEPGDAFRPSARSTGAGSELTERPATGTAQMIKPLGSYRAHYEFSVRTR